MGHVDDGDAKPLVNVLDLQLHLLAQLFVQRAQRLVHEHKRGLEHERPGERHPLLLTAGQLVGPAPAKPAQLDDIQNARHLRPDLLFRDAPHFQRKCQVLFHGHVGEQGIALKHHADVAFVRWKTAHGPAVDLDIAARRRFEAGEHHQDRRLARSRWPEEGQEFALANVQIQVADDQRLSVKGLVDSAKPDEYVVLADRRFRALAH